MSKYLKKIFGSLTVVAVDTAQTAGGNPRQMFTLRCSCGATIRRAAQRVLRMKTPTCPACRAAADAATSAAGWKHPLHGRWLSMVNRCHNPDTPHYAWYGARGIAVCAQWRGRRPEGELATIDGFHRFVADMGSPPSSQHSLDRRDNDGDYTPDNCRWATPSEQALNTRANVLVTHSEVSRPISEWGRVMGHKYPDVWAAAARKYGVALPDALQCLVGRPQPRSWLRVFRAAGLVAIADLPPSVLVTCAGRTQPYTRWLLDFDISVTEAYRRKRGRTFTELVEELHAEQPFAG